jgi:hypothetical protein
MTFFFNPKKIQPQVGYFAQCLALIFIPISSFGLFEISLSKLALAFSLTYMILKRVLENRLAISQTEILVLLFTIYIMLSSVATMNFASRFILPFLIISYFVLLDVPKRVFETYCCLTIIVLISFISVGIWMNGNSILFFLSVILPAATVSGGGGEAPLLFRDSFSWFSEGLKVVGVDALIIFFTLWHSKLRLKSYFLILCTFIVIMSLSRTVWLTFTLLMLFVIIRNRIKLSTVFWGASILGLLALFLGDIIMEVITNRVFANDVGLSSREYLFQTVFQDLDISLFGSGVGSVFKYLQINDSMFGVNNMHNVYAETLMDLGILGLAFLIFLFFHLAWKYRANSSFYILASVSIISLALLSPYAYSFWVAIGFSLYIYKQFQMNKNRTRS